MTGQLKSCPWCKSKDIEIRPRSCISTDVEKRFGSRSIHKYMQCQSCGASGPDCYSEEEAVAAWNTRHESDELPEWVIDAIGARVALFESDKHTWTIEMRDGALNSLYWVLYLRKPEEQE